VKDRNAARTSVDEIDDLVEMPGERVNVFAVERGHECPVDPVDRIVSEVVRLVLERLYLGDVLVQLVRILEKLVQERRGARKLGGNLRKKRIELIVARNELQV
jgi:hypothetical protein